MKFKIMNMNADDLNLSGGLWRGTRLRPVLCAGAVLALALRTEMDAYGHGGRAGGRCGYDQTGYGAQVLPKGCVRVVPEGYTKIYYDGYWRAYADGVNYRPLYYQGVVYVIVP